MQRRSVSIPAMLAGLLLAAAAQASDGVVEINQACAGTGCFPSDAPGFPVTITESGSYRLTSNLLVSANTSAITVGVARVQIDLGGFEVRGSGSCIDSGSALTCFGHGTSTGIKAEQTGIRVANGTVRGFGNGGVYVGTDGQADSIRVEENLNYGIGGGSVSDVVAERNFGVGISVSPGIVRGCVSLRNRGDGISVFAGRVADNVVDGNSGIGIRADTASIVSDNIVRANGAQGIFLSGSGIARNNAVMANVADGIVGNDGALIVGNTSRANGQAGIVALSAGSVLDNVVRGNTGIGIYLFPEQGGAPAAFRGNVVISTPPSSSVTNGVNMGENACNGATTCP
ncbi:MAG: right-handed parallel beta-helix repeat-containing protein [Myxococcota bacterium]